MNEGQGRGQQQEGGGTAAERGSKQSLEKEQKQIFKCGTLTG